MSSELRHKMFLFWAPSNQNFWLRQSNQPHLIFNVHKLNEMLFRSLQRVDIMQSMLELEVSEDKVKRGLVTKGKL